MKNIALLIILIFVLIGTAFGQKELKKISTDDYEIWENLSRQNISNDGQWVTYQVDKIKEEDGYLVIYNAKNKAEKKIPRGYNAQIASNSSFVVFKIAPEFDKVRELKLKKSKKSELPNDSLGIYLTEKDSLIKIADVKDYDLAKEGGDWLTYSMSSRKIKISKESDENIWQKLWSKNNPEYESKTIKNLVYIYNPIKDSLTEYIEIEDFDISYNGDVIALIQEEKADSLKKLKLHIFNTNSSKTAVILDTIATATKISLDRKGEQLTMLFSTDTVKKNKVYSLFYANINDSSYSVIVDTNTRYITEDYSPSIFKSPYFSEDGSKIYFGIAPKPEVEEEDSLLKEEKYDVDIWHYDDGLLQTQQQKQAASIARKNYLAVFHVNAKKLTVLADSLVETVRTVNKGNSNLALGMANEKYEKEISWDGWYNDYYLINLISGDRMKFLEKSNYYVYLAPESNYVVYFNNDDSSWYSYDINKKIHSNLTSELEYNFYNEDDDTPQLPSPYGILGWSKDNESVFIKDRFDIWKFNLRTKKSENITNFYGRKNGIRLSFIKLDYEQEYVDEEDFILLRGFNTKHKSSGYYKYKFDKNDPSQLVKLISSDHLYHRAIKSKNSDKILWRRESFRVYPNLYYSDINFQSIRQISDLNLQQSDYVWGDVELYKWEAYDGTDMEGLLYKPSNFDSTKKYPMIVYFYEKYSDNLHRYYVPKPSHSTINFTEYVSNGYVIFVPDIVYQTGKPGESAYNCIVSGTKSLMKENWIDTNKIGIQGQSWGGYQVAYLITRTNIYAAAESGAPVSNMTSAYGGIRWGSGMSRAFQYEKGQSRIGVDMWTDLDLYIENSPIFFADKVETPLLIMHNTKDGAVPWSQGIEYFSALRRLDKKVWMLSYDDDHNLMKWPNRVDLNIRMKQFFDYYLKDEQMPLWMKEGLPYSKKGKEDAYELVE